MTETNLWVGEVGVELIFPIKDEHNQPYDLTGYTCTLVITGGTTKTCTITNATKGICSYSTESGAFSAGDIECQIKLEQGANVYYSDKFIIPVGTPVS